MNHDVRSAVWFGFCALFFLVLAVDVSNQWVSYFDYFVALVYGVCCSRAAGKATA